MKKIFLFSVLLLMVGCAQMPEATGTAALAVSDASSATTAGEVGEIINNDVNIPMWMVGAAMLAAWMVRTPWGMLSDFLGQRKLIKGALG